MGLSPSLQKHGKVRAERIGIWQVIMGSIALSVIVVAIAAVLHAVADPVCDASCKCIPGDACWPSPQDWQQLNLTVDGRLIATSLMAEVCHDPHYDVAACDALKSSWELVQTQISHPESIMAPLFQNQTCDPFTPRAQACTLGNYVTYSINVSSASDVTAGIKFALDHNIRLVIKNTGHDYLGKSTGKGALSLWTHNLKSISFSNYTSSHYTGPAVKMGAGVQGYEAYKAATAVGLRVMGGDCPTVGLAGGYTQGGGHSSLSSIHGMAADSVLEWEVVTANGTRLVATPTQNSDLYWALSGGGAGTFGVVLSLTSKAYPDGIFGGASMMIPSAGLSTDAFYEVVEHWHSLQLSIVDAGGVAVYIVLPFAIVVQPIGLPGKTKAEVDTFLAPFLDTLSLYGITPSTGLQIQTTSFPTFFEHFFHYLGPYPYGTIGATQVTGGRLVPRSVFENNNRALTNATRRISAVPGMTFVGFTLNPTLAAGNVTAASNAVLPAWRDTVTTVFIMGAWNYSLPRTANLQVQKAISETVGPMLKSIAPGSGTYLNEANFEETDWKRDFYGTNYEQLVKVKKKYDPGNFFYARTAVGSDGWEADGDGRLCRVCGGGDVGSLRDL